MATRPRKSVAASETFIDEPLSERRANFSAELDWTLRRLGAARLRVTVACLTLPRDGKHGQRTAEVIAAMVARQSALAGVDTDGAVLAASFGPRRFGVAGDMEEAHRLVGWFREAVAEVAPELEGRAMISVAHLWSDEWVGLAPYTRRVMFAAPLPLAGLAEAV
ncbi:MAG TPA: hypothetical protein VHA10_09795 [Hypericibacter adhaerens]|uniref:Uncharacterized protein n=1 Tax=Hypericibacter adhaerens TaxID=2602016 RepID=A0A5J6N1I1_9PROT|nr:hypothetical protein [Hypericibacter adhaerens]QEX22430.1 hypothetical protein FRZ61_23610 [Hypericibacter adhaerens]HWA43490.1 hypothetical protein [Hypericibacter adhaerens]